MGYQLLRHRSGYLAAFLMILTAGCANPQIGGIDRFVATTPQTFSETRVFYLDQARSGPNGASSFLRPMKLASEVADLPINGPTLSMLNTTNASASASAAVERAKARPSFVTHGQPLSVLINKAITPQYSGTKDIAVVLEILTQSTEKVQPLVVWYQRDVPGGKELLFENLLVYFTPSWDSKMPVHFRLRMIDVKAEKNAATLSLLAGVEKLSGAFSGAVPHPIMPGVQLGIAAAKLILGNHSNTLLMDYTVEFFAIANAREFGGADIGYLRTGHWLAVGLNRQQSSEFWRRPKFFDQRTLRIYEEEAPERLLAGETASTSRKLREDGRYETAMPAPGTVRPRLDAPILLMTIGIADSVVPTVVQDRSEALIQLLSTAPDKLSLESLQTTMTTLNSSVKVFTAKRRVEKDQTKESMDAVFDLLAKHKASMNTYASEDDKMQKLSDGDLKLLLLTLERNTLIDPAPTTTTQWLNWWNNKGSRGSFQFNEILRSKMWVSP